MRISTVAVLVVAGLMFGVGVAAAPAPADKATNMAKVRAVIERTKTVHTTYAAYIWTRITPEGGAPIEEWAAEFHSGVLHRVEVPQIRAIANCQAKTGVSRSLVDGATTSGPDVAAVACGISTRAPFLTEEWIGLVDSPFGKADRIRLTDKELVRTYDISRDGVILRTLFAKNTPAEPVVLANRAVAILPRLPAGAMFDEASLQKSFVPDQYRHAPK